MRCASCIGGAHAKCGGTANGYGGRRRCECETGEHPGRLLRAQRLMIKAEALFDFLREQGQTSTTWRVPHMKGRDENE